MSEPSEHPTEDPQRPLTEPEGLRATPPPPDAQPEHSGEPGPEAAPPPVTEALPSTETAPGPEAALPPATETAPVTEAAPVIEPAPVTEAAPVAEAAPATEAAPTSSTEPVASTPPAEDRSPNGVAPAADAATAPEASTGPARARPGGRGPGDRKRPERRRRPSPAQRHRNAFYAKLSELRRQDEAEQHGKADGPTAEDVEVVPAEGVTPADEASEAAPPPPPPPPQPQAGRVPLPGRAQARVRAAVERVGGDEAVREALAPKQRSDGQTMKWSAVCCDAAQGLAAGDPTFTAWARLAVTPVREIKGLVDPRDREGRGGGRGGGGPQRGRGGGGGDRPWRDRGQGGGGAGAEDLRQHGSDGSFKSRIRIVDMSKGRDDPGADEGEAKKREAAERLDRLGY